MQITSWNKRMYYALVFALMAVLLMPHMVFDALAAATSGTHNPIDGVTVTVSDATDNSLSNDVLTVTAQGTDGWLFIPGSSKTTTITVSNSSTSIATISFDWEASSVNTLQFDGVATADRSNTFSKALGKGETITITIITGRNSTVNTLALSNFQYQAAAATSSVTILFDSNLGTVTVDGNAVANNDVKELPSSGADLVATPSSGTTFLGWVDENGVILKTDTSYTLTPASDMVVIAAFASSSANGWFLVGSNLYNDLNEAASVASGGPNKTIILAANGTLPEGDYTIPSGVTLLIPYDDANTLCTTSPTRKTHYESITLKADAWVKPSAYRTLKMASGANITVNGAISISGAQCSAQKFNGFPMGPLGFIDMGSGSSITVNSGAFLYAWGYIVGSGAVTIKSGGTVYEDFQLRDWRGGSAASGMIDNDEKVFPVSQYYVQNVEVPMTFEAGALEFGHISMVVTLAGYQSSTVPFIGGNGMFINSGTITKDYIEESDYLQVNVSGDLIMQNLTIRVYTYNMDSSNYTLPITNNLSVHVNSGTTTIGQDMCMLPGSVITVAEGAKVSLAEGVSFYLYDVEEWIGKNYVYSSCDVSPLPYANRGTPTTRTLTDAKIVVNGTVDASKGYVYTTASGGNIMSDGGGVAITGAHGSATTTYQYVQSTSTYDPISVNAAWLRNGDGSYVQSETNAYVYMNEKWMPYFMTNVSLGNNLDVYFAVLDYGTNTVTSLTGPNGDASSRELIDGTEIGLNSYKYIIYSGLAAKNMTDPVTLAVNNSILGTMIKEDSIRDYAVRMMNKHSDKTKLRTLIVDMLNYGAACQTYFNHNTDDLANTGVEGTGSSYDMPAATDPPTSDVFDGSQLITTGNIQFAVKPKEGVSAADAKYSFTDHWGQPITDCDLKQATDNNGDTYYYIDGIVVADAAEDGFKITIKINDTPVYEDSIAAYCARMYHKDGVSDAQKKVYLAFMKFSQSANAYLEGDKLP